LQFHGDLAAASGNSLLAAIVAQLVNIEHHPLWALVNQRAQPCGFRQPEGRRASRPS
jgi:DNA-binding GntR family transcriptional regulator